MYRSLVPKTRYKGARQLIRREEKKDGRKGEGRDAGASTILPESPLLPHHPVHEALLLISLPKKETQLETRNIQLAHHVENS